MIAQHTYRELHRQLVIALEPQNVLDVGCGDGAFVATMAAAGVPCEGVDPDPARVAAGRAAGHALRQAHGEALPYADGAFDVVVSGFSAHHMTDLARFLAEACRVARRAVVVLDPWYDLTIASQRTSERWDRWFKAIDRARGRVHEPFLTAEHFRAALPAIPRLTCEFRHYLELRELDPDYFERETADYLPLADAALAAELRAIRAERERTGTSEDGAMHVVLRLPGFVAGQP